MKLGKKTKTKLPACQHRDAAMNMNGQEMPEVFKIVWIEAIGFHCVLDDRQRLSCLRHVWIVYIELFSFVQPNLQTRNCPYE